LQAVMASMMWTSEEGFSPAHRLGGPGFGSSSSNNTLAFLLALNPTSLTSLILNEASYAPPKLISLFGPHATFQTLFPHLQELVLHDQTTRATYMAQPLIQQLLMQLPRNLKTLQLNMNWGSPPLSELPPSLTSISVGDHEILSKYSTNEHKPAESVVRALAQRLPNLAVLRLLLPNLPPNDLPMAFQVPAVPAAVNTRPSLLGSPFEATHQIPVPHTSSYLSSFITTHHKPPTNPLSHEEDQITEKNDMMIVDHGYSGGVMAEEVNPAHSSQSSSDEICSSEPIPSQVMDVDKTRPLFPMLQELDIATGGSLPELTSILGLCSNITTLSITFGRIELGSESYPIEYPPNLTSMTFRSDGGFMAPSAVLNLPPHLVQLSFIDVKFNFGLTKETGRSSVVSGNYPEFEEKHWQDLLPRDLRHLITSGIILDFTRLPPRLELCKQHKPTFGGYTAVSDFSCLPRSITELRTHQGLPAGDITRLSPNLTRLTIPGVGFNQEHVMALHEHLPKCHIRLLEPIIIHAPMGSSQYASIFELNMDPKHPHLLQISNLMERYSRPFRHHIDVQWTLSAPDGVEKPKISSVVPTSGRFGGSLLYGQTPQGSPPPNASYSLRLPPDLQIWLLGQEAQSEHLLGHVSTLPNLTELRLHPSFQLRFTPAMLNFNLSLIRHLQHLTVLELGHLSTTFTSADLPRSLTVLRSLSVFSSWQNRGRNPISEQLIPSELPTGLQILDTPSQEFLPQPEGFPASLTELNFVAPLWLDTQLYVMKTRLKHLKKGFIRGTTTITGDMIAPQMKGEFSPQRLLHDICEAMLPLRLDTCTIMGTTLDKLSEGIDAIVFDFDDQQFLAPHIGQQSAFSLSNPKEINGVPFAHRRIWLSGKRIGPKERGGPRFVTFEPSLPYERKPPPTLKLLDNDHTLQISRPFPSSLTKLKILSFDCTKFLMEMICPSSKSPQRVSSDLPNLESLELIFSGNSVHDPFHRFPSTLRELILHTDHPIHCSARGLADLPNALTVLRCTELCIPPSFSEFIPDTIVDLSFNGCSIWTDTQIQALGQRIGEKLVKLQVRDAIVSGAFIPSEVTEISEEILFSCASDSLGKKYDCKWVTLAKPLTKLPDSVTSLNLLDTRIKLIPRHITSFPKSLTSLQLYLEADVSWTDLQGLPATLHHLSFVFALHTYPAFDEWIWSVLPRGLNTLSMTKGLKSRIQHSSEIVIPNAPTESVVTSLMELPPMLTKLYLPFVSVSLACVSNLGPHLQTISVSSNTPNELKSRLASRFPNAAVFVF
jgi:hypothetical protein